MNTSRHAPNQWSLGEDWNYYVDASIAFLKQDRAGLFAARAALVAMPVQADEKWVDSKGRPIVAPKQPLNLDVIDGFIRCFGKPYKIAYGQACRISEEH